MCIEKDILMDYDEGKSYMIKLCRNDNNGYFQAYRDIIVNYPGSKKPGDYRIEVNGRAPTHSQICRQLYKLIRADDITYIAVYKMLVTTYCSGTHNLAHNLKIRYLQNLIYWITLQEEINYPREKGYAGINLAFCRFFEAIYAINTDRFTINDVCNRCANNGRQKPSLYDIEDAPEYYHY
jgi:hypothetical protein